MKECVVIPMFDTTLPEWKFQYMLDYAKKDFESSYSHSREGDNVDELDMQFDKKIGALKRENDVREFNRGRR